MRKNNFHSLLFFCITLITVAIMLPISAQSVRAQAQNTTDQEMTAEAKVIRILDEKEITVDGKKQTYQKLELHIIRGEGSGKTITVENGTLPIVNEVLYHAGDGVVLQVSRGPNNKLQYYITDSIRRVPLAVLLGIFLILTVIVGGLRGMSSLIGMGISFMVIFVFILPQILAGRDPVFITIIGSLIIVPVTFYLSHGLNSKTTAGIIGTFGSLIVTGLLAMLFVNFAHLTGYASEEAAYLQATRPNVVNMQGVLLAGIIIGVLGILNDITISQAAIVMQLKKASEKLTFGDLYLRAMEIGKDHIASTVNTLVLVYAGTALPLLLLFLDNPQPFTQVINYEPLAEEIIRTLVASIGLILAVPLTTFIACVMVRRKHHSSV